MATPTTVNDVMTQSPVVATPGMTIREVARLFETHRISGAPVVGADGTLVGVVSKTDLIRRCSEGTADNPPGYLFELVSGSAQSQRDTLPEPLIVVSDFMSADPLTAKTTDALGPLAREMNRRRVHRAIVVDDRRKPIGVVTSLDLLRAIA